MDTSNPQPNADFDGPDCWGALPAIDRESFLACGRARHESLHEGMVGSEGRHRALRPLIIAPDCYDELAALSWRLSQLVLKSCQLRASTAGELRRALGLQELRLPLLREDDALDESLLVAARPDVLYSHGVPLVVEMNIDGAVGATWHVDALSQRFDRVRVDAGMGSRLQALPSAVASRLRAIRHSVGDRPRPLVVIPIFDAGAPKAFATKQDFIDWLSPMCEQGDSAELDVIACDADDLEVTSAALVLGGRRVDVVFRLMSTHVQPPSLGLAAVAKACELGHIRMHTPETTFLLSSKTTLAWLWEDLRSMGIEDRDLVEKHVPRTTALGAENSVLAVRDRFELVLKPATGYAGHGVIIGRESRVDEWEDALARAAATPHVLQQYVQPDVTEMQFIDTESEDTVEAEVPFALSPYIFNGECSGILVRHGVPYGGNVLNVQRGAQINTAMMGVPA